MKYILLIITFLLLEDTTAFSQLLYPDVMESRPSVIQPVKHMSKKPMFPKYLSGLRKKIKNSTLENPGFRYTVQNLKKEQYNEPELDNALKILLRYAENDTIKNMIGYMRNYIKTTGQTEQAVATVKKKLAYDSIEFYSGDEYLMTQDYASYMNQDLNALVTFFQEDSNYIWLKNISRDSVMLEILNKVDNSVRFWINNGREETHRFWAINSMGDSIGTRIQVLPAGNNIRVYVDDDVYQAKEIDMKIQPPTIKNQMSDSSFYIRDPQTGRLRRRYWTYYSEVEAALGQGAQANWANGGENSLSLLANARYFLNYNKNKNSWESFLHYRIGFLKSGDQELRKNDDRLEFNTKLGKRVSEKTFKHWYYTAQFNAQTLLFDSYEYPDTGRKLVGNILSPGYFTVSIGLDYKPNNHFSLFLSPIAGKWTYVRDTTGIDPTRYGVEKGKKAKSDAGARLELRNTFELFKFIKFRNELMVFTSYYDKPQYITADWKVQVDFKINYFMRTSIYMNIIYDQNYSKKLQVKETLNLGLNFRF